MRIKLNTDVQSMFPLLGLTWERPGPIEVDPNKLTSQQKLWIDNAIIKGVLIAEGYTVQPKIAVTPAVEKKESAQDLLKQVEESRKNKTLSIETVLKGPVAAITSHINESNDLISLRAMRGLEKANKNRKKVLEALTQKISSLETAVANKIGPALVSEMVVNKDLQNLPEIEEEIEEEKTFIIKQGE